LRRFADVLGHRDPALTLRVYAHAMHEAETDLSFADFGGPERPYTAPTPESDEQESPSYANSWARREGFEEKDSAIRLRPIANPAERYRCGPPTPRFEDSSGA
jgi:hypothetical protein